MSGSSRLVPIESKWKPNGDWWWWSWCCLPAAAAKSRGRPLPRFMAAPTAEAGVYCPAATVAAMGADAEIGVALSGRIRLPSGPYFLGLPRFFGTFIATGPSASAPPAPAAAGGPAAGGGGPVAGGDTNTPLELPFSTAAAGAADWKLTVASGAAVTTGAAAAAAAALCRREPVTGDRRRPAPLLPRPRSEF